VLSLKGFDEVRNAARLEKIIIHLVPHCLEGSGEIRIAGHDVRPGTRLRPSHGANYDESVARLADVQIRKQDVKLLRLISAIASHTLPTVVQSNPSLVSIRGRVCLSDSSSSTNRSLGLSTLRLDAMQEHHSIDRFLPKYGRRLSK